MKTEQPVLPWHREAAKEINKALLRQNPTVSAIIARHDPHAATLRLLEEVVAVIEERTTGHTVVYSDRLRLFIDEIRAHLAAMKGNQ